MLKIVNEIAHAKQQVFSQLDPAARPSNGEVIEGIANTVEAAPQVAAPANLLKGRWRNKIVRVSNETMNLLEFGEKIAKVTDELLDKGAGNQLLSRMSAPEANALIALAREHLPRTSSADAVFNAVVTRVGNCADRSLVSKFLAQSMAQAQGRFLDMRGAIVSDSLNDHTYLLLNDEVVIDSWPTFSTVCTSREHDYQPTKVDQEFTLGDALPQKASLDAMLEVRERVEHRLGPNGMTDELLDRERVRLKIHSELLDRHLLQQGLGLASYHRIDLDEVPPPERAAVQAELQRMKKQTWEALLHRAAHSSKLKAKTKSIDPPRITRASGAAGQPQEVDAAVRRARQTAKQKAKAFARREVIKAADQEMRRNRQTCVAHPIKATAGGSSTETVNGVSVTVGAKAVATVTPTLRDERTTAPLVTYRSPDGRVRRFDRVSHAELEKVTVQEARAKRANFPHAYLDPDKALALAPDQSQGVTAAALARAAWERVGQELARLHPAAPGETPVQAAARQSAALRQIESRLDCLYSERANECLQRVAVRLDRLAPAARQDAVTLLGRWRTSIALAARRFVDDRIARTGAAAGSHYSAQQLEDLEHGLREALPQLATLGAPGLLANLIELCGELPGLDGDCLVTAGQVLAETVDLLAQRDDPGRLRQALATMVETWVGNYGKAGTRAQLGPILAHNLTPESLASHLCLGLLRFGAPAVRQDAIAEIGRHLERTANAELPAAMAYAADALGDLEPDEQLLMLEAMDLSFDRLPEAERDVIAERLAPLFNGARADVAQRMAQLLGEEE